MVRLRIIFHTLTLICCAEKSHVVVRSVVSVPIARGGICIRERYSTGMETLQSDCTCSSLAPSTSNEFECNTCLPSHIQKALNFLADQYLVTFISPWNFLLPINSKFPYYLPSLWMCIVVRDWFYYRSWATLPNSSLQFGTWWHFDTNYQIFFWFLLLWLQIPGSEQLQMNLTSVLHSEGPY